MEIKYIHGSINIVLSMDDIELINENHLMISLERRTDTDIIQKIELENKNIRSEYAIALNINNYDASFVGHKKINLFIIKEFPYVVDFMDYKVYVDRVKVRDEISNTSDDTYSNICNRKHDVLKKSNLLFWCNFVLITSILYVLDLLLSNNIEKTLVLIYACILISMILVNIIAMIIINIKISTINNVNYQVDDKLVCAEKLINIISILSIVIILFVFIFGFSLVIRRCC